MEERNEEKEVYPVEKTEDNESEQKETESKTSEDGKSGNDQKYINNEELLGSDDKTSEEDQVKEKIEEKLVTSEENEDGKEDDNKCDETENKEKKVCFDFNENDVEEENKFVQIQVQVDNIVKTVIGMEDTDEDARKHKIDDFYVNFPSSQSRLSEHMEILSNQLKTEEKEKYSIDPEDISDVEDLKAKKSVPQEEEKENDDKKEEQLEIEDDKICDITVDDGKCEEEGESDGETNIRKKDECTSGEKIEEKEKEKEDKPDDTAE